MDIFQYIFSNDMQKTKEWINNNEYIDIKDNFGKTPLIVSAEIANTTESIKIVKMLLDKGADPNIQDNSGWTALMIAADITNTTSSNETVELLLKYGTDPNIQNIDGWTALMIAVRYSNYTSSMKTVKLLLDYGADPNIKGNSGWTALALGVFYSNSDSSLETVKILLDNGADPNIKIKNKLLIDKCPTEECKNLIMNKDMKISNERYGGYNPIEFKGEGGSGKVWKIYKDNKYMALKVIPFKPNKKDIYIEEITMLKEISNPNCHPFLSCIYNYNIIGNKIYIEMEYIDGKELNIWSNNYPDHNILHKLLIHVIIDLTEALYFLQSKGIIHQDIKPANILITPDNIPKLVDFGLSCKTDIYKLENYCEHLGGTPNFIAPEIIKNGLSYYSSDIWSLGASIYVVGIEAYNKKLAMNDILENLKYEDPMKFTDNKTLDIVIRGCLIRDPLKRFSLHDIKRIIKSIFNN